MRPPAVSERSPSSSNPDPAGTPAVVAPTSSRARAGVRGCTALLLTLVTACGSTEGGGPLLRRHGSVLVEGCTLDGWQQATLASDAARQVISEVVLLCLSVHDDGGISPDAASREALARQVSSLRDLGFAVSLGVTSRGDDLVDYPPERIAGWLRNRDVRDQVTTTLSALARGASGLDVALPQLPDGARADLSAWITELSAAVRPGAQLGLLAPPSSMEPSDLPGGAAYDLRALAPQLDRVRLMTLDYSCCGEGPGASTDPAWIGGVFGLARARTGTTALSFALPLYGTAFGPGSLERPVGFLEALGLANLYQVQIQRDPAGSLHFDYTDKLGAARSVWFDDARSLTGYQQALDAQVPADVGAFYYGLGTEDPALWGELLRRR